MKNALEEDEEKLNHPSFYNINPVTGKSVYFKCAV